MLSIKIEDTTLEELEICYKKLDIITSFMRILNKMEDYNIVMKEKETISTLLIEKIKSLKKQTKKCNKCNKKIPLNYPYNICGECHEKMNSTNVLFFEEDDDF
jgi:ATP-dependent RNA helicase SUPV3L1/SUV3